MHKIPRTLNKSCNGFRIPAIGLGTYSLQGTSGRRSVTEAIDAGYRHIDTARMYGNEIEVGHAIMDSKVERKDFFVTSKVWPSHLSKDGVAESLEGSLRDLQTDYLDLLLVHWPNPEVPLEETFDAFLKARESEKILHLGVSNFPAPLMSKALSMAPVVCNQIELNPFKGSPELLALATIENFMVTAYTPLARGRVAREPVFKEIGKRHGKTAAQITLRWLVEQSHVVAIPRASTQAHQLENLDIFDFQLSARDVEAINSLPKA